MEIALSLKLHESVSYLPIPQSVCIRWENTDMEILWGDEEIIESNGKYVVILKNIEVDYQPIEFWYKELPYMLSVTALELADGNVMIRDFTLKAVELYGFGKLRAFRLNRRFSMDKQEVRGHDGWLLTY